MTTKHTEAYVVPICAYCGKSHGTVLASEYDAENLPCRWYHPECKKQADLDWLRRQWQRHDMKSGGL